LAVFSIRLVDEFPAAEAKMANARNAHYPLYLVVDRSMDLLP